MIATGKYNLPAFYENYDRQTDRPTDQHMGMMVHRKVIRSTEKIKVSKQSREKKIFFTLLINTVESMNKLKQSYIFTK